MGWDTESNNPVNRRLPAGIEIVIGTGTDGAYPVSVSCPSPIGIRVVVPVEDGANPVNTKDPVPIAIAPISAW